MMLKQKLLIVVNLDSFLISHRYEILQAAIKKYKVSVVSKDTGFREVIEELGVNFYNVNFDQSGTKLIKEVSTFIELLKIYKRERPDLVHHVTMKPILYGSLISRFYRKIHIVNAISGLGYSFSNSQSGVLSNFITLFMRVIFPKNRSYFIFQNKDDVEDLKKNKISISKYSIIKGSGVDLDYFTYHVPVKKDKVYVILPCRMIQEKGVKDFVSAANLLRNKYEGKVLFHLIGDLDLNKPEPITKTFLNDIFIKGYLEWIGFKEEMLPYYIQSDIVVLPSYYREGLPKALIEACAVGRSIITTDSIGCRDCVVDGENGYLVPTKSSLILAKTMEKLILSESRRLEMGKKGRLKAEKEFSVKDVVDKHLKIYSNILFNN